MVACAQGMAACLHALKKKRHDGDATAANYKRVVNIDALPRLGSASLLHRHLEALHSPHFGSFFFMIFSFLCARAAFVGFSVLARAQT